MIMIESVLLIGNTREPLFLSQIYFFHAWREQKVNMHRAEKVPPLEPLQAGFWTFHFLYAEEIGLPYLSHHMA